MRWNNCKSWATCIAENIGYRALENVFRFLAAFLDLNSEYNKTASMMRVYTARYGFLLMSRRHDKSVKGQRRASLEGRGKAYESMLVRTLESHRDSSLYTLWYYLLYYRIENILNFRALSVSDSTSHERNNALLKQANRIASQTKWTKICAREKWWRETERMHCCIKKRRFVRNFGRQIKGSQKLKATWHISYWMALQLQRMKKLYLLTRVYKGALQPFLHQSRSEYLERSLCKYSSHSCVR